MDASSFVMFFKCYNSVIESVIELGVDPVDTVDPVDPMKS